jgi:hypothetical protein
MQKRQISTNTYAKLQIMFFLNKNMNLSEFKSNNGNFMIKGRQIEPTKIPHINTIEVGDSCNVNSVDMCVHSHIVPKKEIEKSFPII